MHRLAALFLLAALGACAQNDLRYDFDGDGIEDSADCAPADATVHPGADDPFGDSIDQNCDGADGVDADGDSYPANAAEGAPNWDCNDSVATTFPGALEVIDGLDNDCDGDVDDGTSVSDDDGDGFCEEGDCVGAALPGDCDDADPERSPADRDGDGVSTCDDPPDCDDLAADVHPGATETCDGLDGDCVGGPMPSEIDQDLDGQTGCEGDCDDTDVLVHSLDVDGDGQTLCDDPPDCDDTDAAVTGADADADGVTTCDGDCDDTLASVRPGVVEVCDGLDTDCDGVLPANESDGDGDGDPICSDCDDDQPALHSLDADQDGVSTCLGDCDDADPTQSPALLDPLGDGLDTNCDGVDGVDNDGDGLPQGVDCDDTAAALNDDDADGDGASTCDGDCDDGDPSANLDDVDFDGFDTCEGDCDDGAYGVNPSVLEVCDFVDNDCDGVQVDEGDGDGDGSPLCADCDDGDAAYEGLDADGDGLSTCGPDGVADTEDDDCNDVNPLIYPAALDPYSDGVDTNCDGVDGVDVDGDTWASVASGGADCDDGAAAVFPGAAETYGDGIDQDCDGVDGLDADTDGYASLATGGEDCDDANPAVHPGFWEEAGDGLDGNCDGLDGMEFQIVSGGVGGYWGYDVANCDLNGDGVLDLASASGDGAFGAVGVLYGPVGPAASFASTSDVIVGTAGAAFDQKAYCAGDTNGDGNEDLLVGAGGYGWLLYLGPVLGTLGPADADWSLPLTGAPSQGVGGNFDGAGPGDLVACSTDCWVFAGPLTGAGATTQAIATISLTPGLDEAAAGDVNGDGVDDLLVGFYGGITPLLFQGPLSGSIQEQSAIASFPGVAGDFEIGREAKIVDDLNGDGRDEVLIGNLYNASWGQDGTVGLYYGPVAGAEQRASADVLVTVPGLLLEAAACDVDGDGLPELFTYDDTGSAAVISMFAGPLPATASATPADAVAVFGFGNSSLGNQAFDCVDLEGDGSPDLVLGLMDLNQVRIATNPYP